MSEVLAYREVLPAPPAGMAGYARVGALAGALAGAPASINESREDLWPVHEEDQRRHPQLQ